ncbi:B-box-type zinc finger [Dillenia turbinata]|uniref:B-box-type zinc finger n=1 Tax=Dillenia turbinata TaxID=194707 RepID=A0AAN8VP63_9MAGN
MTESATTPKTGQQGRLCDFCGERTALLYCRADSAKLCIICDRDVHSTNPLFKKHTRTLLCDACDSFPVSVICVTESSVFCQNCDWERHNRTLSCVHDRRPHEGFTGCPSGTELGLVLGFDDLNCKSLFDLNDCGAADLLTSDDLFVWNSPDFVSLNDLIGSTNDSSCHNLKAVGVPTLPKNRKAACGQYKDEILCQLHQLLNSDPSSNHGFSNAENLTCFPSLKPEDNMLDQNTFASYEPNAVLDIFPAYDVKVSDCVPLMQINAFQCCSDSGEATNQVLLPSWNHGEESRMAADKNSDIGRSVAYANNDREGQLRECNIRSNSRVPLKITPHELNSQERDSAISRYKEKKKTRSYLLGDIDKNAVKEIAINSSKKKKAFGRMFKIESTTSKRKTQEPRRDNAPETSMMLQNLWKSLHTLRHCTCEFPLRPMTPMLAAAPFAEKSRPMMTTSRMMIIKVIALSPFGERMENSREIAAHEHATAFDTT